MPTATRGEPPAFTNAGRRFPPEVLTDAEVRALMDACGDGLPSCHRNRALIALLYRGGLRVSEALALYPKDLDAASGAVRVLNGKGGRARTTGLDPGAFAVLGVWLPRLRSLAEKAVSPDSRLRVSQALDDVEKAAWELMNALDGRIRPELVRNRKRPSGPWTAPEKRLSEAVERAAFMRYEQAGEGASGDPPKNPTRKISIDGAAKAGWFGPMEKRFLKSLIESGNIRATRLSEYRWVFDLDQVATAAREDATPKPPKKRSKPKTRKTKAQRGGAHKVSKSEQK